MSDEGAAHEFTAEVCKGDRDAMICCNLFYTYAHGIDSLIDDKEDGRPIMSNEEIIKLFVNSAFLFNCPFFKKHSEVLLGTVLSVTNTWADSVAWEKSPIDHRRLIADVLRCVGNEFFFMIAMLCGGWDHLRSVSGRIRETDWIKQHTKPDDFF